MEAHRPAAILLTMLLTATALLAVVEARAADKTDDEAAIRTAGRARDSAFDALDVEGRIADYAEDAVLMAPSEPAARSRDAIRNSVTRYMGNLQKNAYKQVVDEAVDIAVFGDLAYRSGTFAIKDKTGNAIDHCKWLEIWRKSGGKWHVVREIWNSDMLVPLFFPPDAPESKAPST